MGMANLQRMAQQMQQEMLRIQSELETLEVEGSAGGGVVRATVTGKQELVSVTIDPSTVDPGDVEMLQDLVVAAVNDALADTPETINADPYGAGWLVEITVAGEGADPTAELMDAAAYQALVDAS